MPDLDYSKYSSQTPAKPTRWTPPIPESTMRYRSSKIPASTRIYPEYLLAAYAYLEQKHGLQPTSLSELIGFALSEMLNLAGLTPPDIPDPATALEFLASQGFHTADYKSARGSHAQISRKADELEQAAHKNPLSAEALEYWKLRDPEKYEELLQLWEARLAELADDFDLEEVSEQASKNKEAKQARFEELLSRDNSKKPSPAPSPQENPDPQEKPDPEDLEAKVRQRQQEEQELKNILGQLPE